MSRPAELPRLDVVFVKELAHASGLCETTIIRRMRLWERRPADPLAIPYLVKLGRPYRTTRAAAARLLSLEGKVLLA